MLSWLLRHRRKIMVAAGAIGFTYAAYRSDVFLDSSTRVWSNWKVRIYCSLPLKPLSRVWGKVNSYEIPHFLRKPILGAYVRWYKCNLEEAESADLRSYGSLQEFFCRSVRADLRPISHLPIVSPGDGVVQWCGQVTDNHFIQVKGISYPICKFFGGSQISDFNLNKKANSLYSCIIYLAPGDYHGFHSPADWQIYFRRHIPGTLLSVSQRIARRVNSLYCLNERVHLIGQWKHGFFSLCAVGATNVGSISIEFEKDFKTNCVGQKFGHLFDYPYEPPHARQKGDKLGEFKLGSSIVLVFEAPDDFQFVVSTGDRVKYGETLGADH